MEFFRQRVRRLKLSKAVPEPSAFIPMVVVGTKQSLSVTGLYCTAPSFTLTAP